MAQKHIFVGGYAGSGTRVIQSILHRAGYFIGGEFANPQSLDYLFGESIMQQLLENQENLPTLFKGMMMLIERHGEPWSVKHGFFMLGMPAIKTIYPDAKFIVVVRHGIDNILNEHEMEVDVGQFICPLDGNDLLEDKIDFWSFCHERLLEDKKTLGTDLHIVKLEDLVDNPVREISKIFLAMGIGEDPAPYASLVKRPRSIGRRQNKVYLEKKKYPYFPDLDLHRLYELGKPTLNKFNYTK